MNHRICSLFLIVLVLASGRGLAQRDSELIFPIVVSGFLGPIANSPRFEASFLMLNPIDTRVTVQLQLFTNDGVEFVDLETQRNLGIFDLFSNRLSARSLHFTRLIAGNIPPRFNGWGRLTFPIGAAIKAQGDVAFYDRPGDSAWEPIFTAQSPAVLPAEKFQVFTVLRPTRRLALAIVNPAANETALVRLEAKAAPASGLASCPMSLTLPPLQRVSRFVDEWCGPITSWGTPPEPLQIIVGADRPIAVGAVDVFLDGHFSSLPVYPIQ